MSWSHIDTDSSRKPAGSSRTSAMMSSPSNRSRMPVASSWRLLAASGIGFPASSNQPTPPPRMRTHSGCAVVGDDPTRVPIVNVW
jgi:hypothetical protein